MRPHPYILPRLCVLRTKVHQDRFQLPATALILQNVGASELVHDSCTSEFVLSDSEILHNNGHEDVPSCAPVLHCSTMFLGLERD